MMEVSVNGEAILLALQAVQEAQRVSLTELTTLTHMTAQTRAEVGGLIKQFDSLEHIVSTHNCRLACIEKEHSERGQYVQLLSDTVPIVHQLKKDNEARIAFEEGRKSILTHPTVQKFRDYIILALIILLVNHFQTIISFGKR